MIKLFGQVNPMNILMPGSSHTGRYFWMARMSSLSRELADVRKAISIRLSNFNLPHALALKTLSCPCLRWAASNAQLREKAERVLGRWVCRAGASTSVALRRQQQRVASVAR